MPALTSVVAPGARVVIRDAEWLVRRVDRTSTGSEALSVVGLSELVKDKEAIFLSEIEKQADGIEVMDPAETRLVPDTSSSFRDSLLYIESLLRQTPPTDARLYCGHYRLLTSQCSGRNRRSAQRRRHRARHEFRPLKARQAALIALRHSHHAFGHAARRQTEVHGQPSGLNARHTKLAVGARQLPFLFETHKEIKS